MFSKIKQLSDLRSQAQQIKQVLAQERVTGSAAWGKISITMDGNQAVQSVTIAEELLADRAKLEAGVKDAINDTVGKVQKVMATKMSQLGNFDLPGLTK